MSTHPYMPLYVDDYEAATAHLTAEEDGVYSRLLRLCWRTPGCSLPDDAAWIARKIRLSAEDFDRVARPILDEFFTRSRARLVQRRLKAEYDDISRKKSARKNAGKKGGDAKARKTKENVSSNASDLPADTRAFPKPEPEPEYIAADDGVVAEVDCAIMWPPSSPPDGEYLDALARILRSVAGACLNATSTKLFVLSPILSLGKAGDGPACDFMADVLPAVQACGARAPPGSVRSWDYFVPAIREARDRRLQGAPAQGQIHERPHPHRPAKQTAYLERLADIDAAMAAAFEPGSRVG